jgi:hypothetical protein
MEIMEIPEWPGLAASLRCRPPNAAAADALHFRAPEQTTNQTKGSDMNANPPVRGTPQRLMKLWLIAISLLALVEAGSEGACTLTDSGPVTATADGQVIENLRINASSGNGITVAGLSGVTIQNCEIHHVNASGIYFQNAPDIHIYNCYIINDGAPASGPNSNQGLNNIGGEYSSGVIISNVKLVRGASGIYLLQCPAPQITFVEGHDFRGPGPRGQLVQFNQCDNALLEDFSCENPMDTSWPEDNVSVFQSSNCTIRRGLLDGNNSPSGVGVMIEQSDGVSQGGLCEDVDAIHQGNGCFSGYPARNFIFRRTRARDNICGDQGRGLPMSGGLAWSGSWPDSSNIQVQSSTYFNLCSTLIFDQSVFSEIDLTPADFTPRAPLRLTFCWESGGGGGGTGLKGSYFANQNLADPATVNRSDAAVNFDWGTGSPDAAIPSDHFSVRWTGQVQPLYSETYAFYTTSDDGVRLWVNGVQLIDNWTDHAPVEDSGTITLSAGQKYSITMEYYENGGGAIAQLSWSSASQAKEIIPSSQLFPPAGSDSVPDGTYKIIARHSGKALDVQDHGTANGSNVQQWTYFGSANQQWTVTSIGNGQYKIIGVESSKSLDIDGPSTADGANAQLWDYYGNQNQTWTITPTSSGYYKIISVYSGKALDVTSGSTADGANVEQWTDNGGDNQQWSFQAP